MIVVKLSHITKTYKNGRGVKDLSLNIEKGQIYGLLGPNGSGKTTAMKIMAGLVHSDSGQATIFGEEPGENIEKALRYVGCLIESPSFYPYLTARQNLELVRKFYPGCSQASIGPLLERLGISAYQDEQVKKYSLGMKQRLGLAMALLSEPQLLILDEPTNGLDIEGMSTVRNILLEQAEKGRTVLLSSHLAGEIEQICTDVAIIKDGSFLSAAKVSGLLAIYGSVENYYLTVINNGKEMVS